MTSRPTDCCICSATEELWVLHSYNSTGPSTEEVACKLHIVDVAETQLHESTHWVIVPILPRA